MTCASPPPSGSGLQVSYVNDVPITGANVVQNVVLVPQAVTVSGTIHTPDGTPVTYASLIVTDQNTGVGVLTINVYEPTYTFTVAPGTYKLDLIRLVEFPVPGLRFTGSFLLRPILTDLVLTGDTTCDLVLPVVRMTGKVLDENGEGVAGVEFITYVSLDRETIPNVTWNTARAIARRRLTEALPFSSSPTPISR